MTDVVVTSSVVFSAGVVSFASPCVLPLVPGYVAVFAGRAPSSPGRTCPRSASADVLKFLGAFLAMFVVLGTSASGLGQILSSERIWLERFGGVLVVAFGLMLGANRAHGSGASRLLPFRVVSRATVHGGPAVLGLAFAVAFTPCATPVLGSALALASSSDSFVAGISLLTVYGLGLALPFLAIALGAQRLLHAFRALRLHYRTVQLVMGATLVGTGIAMATSSLYTIGV